MLVIRAKHCLGLLLFWAMFCGPVEAHVKWFLSRPESEILAQAKPDLFTQISIWNLLPILVAVVITIACYALNKHFALATAHKKLASFASAHEAGINFVMAIFLGLALIYCAITKTLLVPNFIICSHCPWCLPYVELFIGIGLILGFCSRICALALFALLIFTFIKHGAVDSLDLLPYYGLASYFLVAGRNKISLDYVLAIDRHISLPLIELSHLVVRWSMALGLIILAFDEKLFHPQLALELLKYVPSLNFVHGLGVSNEMFVLCSGLAELLLGLMLLLGLFPRFVMIVLAFLFAVTTAIFGFREFFGHSLFYGIIIAISLRGIGTLNPMVALWYFVKEQTGGWRSRSVLKSQEIKRSKEGPTNLESSSGSGTLKHLIPAKPSNSVLAKQKIFLSSGNAVKKTQTESQIALAI